MLNIYKQFKRLINKKSFKFNMKLEKKTKDYWYTQLFNFMKNIKDKLKIKTLAKDN